MNDCVLTVENVVKSFGKFKALDGASLSIPKGSIFGIIGPNGAGKSTLLRIVTSLAHPDSGRVTVNGIDVESSPKKALVGTGAIVDSPAFYPDLTARLNLDILSRGHGKKYRARREELAEYTGIAGWMNHRVREFSLGMRQRLAITLALLPDSSFVILDEPTNGLDPSGIVDIRNLIRNLGADLGATVLVTSHMLGEIEKICSNLAILNHGQIATEGKMEDILRRSPVTLIRTTEPGRAEALLKETFGPRIISLKLKENEENVLRVETRDDCAAELNETLVKNGFSVSMLENEPDRLERIFLQLTGGESAVRSEVRS
ncbi:MAG: ABC transporter ATP-binding protein [Lentisphaeria bacterium]|nr:ABC transporter ATP-binding protein [Lentisphaeria bacterium]